MLQGRLILPPIDLLDVNLGGSLILAIISFGEEELGETDLLFSTRHPSHGSLGGTGEEVSLQGAEVFVLAAASSLNIVFQVDEEGKVCYSAVIVSLSAKYLESVPLNGGLVKNLGGSKLLLFCDLMLCAVSFCMSNDPNASQTKGTNESYFAEKQATEVQRVII